KRRCSRKKCWAVAGRRCYRRIAGGERCSRLRKIRRPDIFSKRSFCFLCRDRSGFIASKLIDRIRLLADVDLIGRKWTRIEKLVRPGSGGPQKFAAIKKVKRAGKSASRS